MNTPDLILRRILTWSQGILERLRGEGRSNEGWVHAVLRLGSELDVLGGSTEGEFLSIGEQLQNFTQRSGEMSKISASVGQLMSGEEIGAVIEDFREVIGRTRLLEDEAGRAATTLRHILELLSHLHGRLSGFHETIRSLRVLCVSTRIESARLGENDMGFKVLADEVRKLASEIEEECSHLLTRTESLSEQVGRTLSRVFDVQARQHAQARLILDKTMSSLESLTERHSLSSSCAAHIAARYDAISRSIGEIVASMQFHDITRQRIEHAKEALSSIAGETHESFDPEQREGTGKESARAGPETVREHRFFVRGNGRRKRRGELRKQVRLAADVCDLQIAQLRNARDTLVSAVNNIVDNLRGLAGLVAEIGQETREMAGAADETERSLLSEVETGFSSITSAFASYAEADREMSLVLGSVGETLGDMSAFAGHIKGIEQRIKLIALNAIVKACHIGDEGMALGVIAESIHQLSVETCRRTETVSAALQSMRSESKLLCDVVAAGGKPAGCEVTGVQQVLEALLSKLTNMNESIVSMLTRMDEEGRALSEDILRTVGGIEVHRRVDAVIGGVVSHLEEIVAASRSLNPVEDQFKAAKHTQTLEAAYTMQAEREVHRSMIKAEGSSEPNDSDLHSSCAANEGKADKTDGKLDEEADGDLGDNVELF